MFRKDVVINRSLPVALRKYFTLKKSSVGVRPLKVHVKHGMLLVYVVSQELLLYFIGIRMFPKKAAQSCIC